MVAHSTTADLEQPATGATSATEAVPTIADERVLSQLERTISGEFSSLSNHSKLLIPFAILLLIKFLVNNLLTGSVVICVACLLERIRSTLNTQIALKSQMSVKVLSWLLLGNLFLMVSFVSILDNIGYTEDLKLRLLFIYGAKDANNVSIGSVIWNCWLTDLFVQMCTMLVKTIVCLCVASHNVKDIWSNLASKSSTVATLSKSSQIHLIRLFSRKRTGVHALYARSLASSQPSHR